MSPVVWCEECRVFLETRLAPDGATTVVTEDDRVVHAEHVLRVQNGPETAQGAHVSVALTLGAPWLGWCAPCARVHAWARVYQTDRPDLPPLGTIGQHVGGTLWPAS